MPTINAPLSQASMAVPNALVQRDSNGRAQVVDPVAAADIATKNYVDNPPSDVPWTALVYISPFADYGGTYDPAQFCKHNGIVFVRGLIKNNTSITNGAPVAQMPVGCRCNVPQSAVVGSGVNGLSTGGHRILIMANGQLRVELVSPGSGTANWVIGCSYFADA